MDLLYEIHVTVKGCDDIPRFKQVCKDLGIKPTVIELGRAGQDVMTSSCVKGDDIAAVKEANRLEQRLIYYGYKVIRKKIEAPPWHPKANKPFLEHNYLEAHIPVYVPEPVALEKLQEVARRANSHLSLNAFNPGVHMVTYRSREKMEDFYKSLEEVEKDLSSAGFTWSSYHVEFALFDSNVEHDEAWLLEPTASVV